jgi:hypothetical protein
MKILNKDPSSPSIIYGGENTFHEINDSSELTVMKADFMNSKEFLEHPTSKGTSLRSGSIPGSEKTEIVLQEISESEFDFSECNVSESFSAIPSEGSNITLSKKVKSAYIPMSERLQKKKF